MAAGGKHWSGLSEELCFGPGHHLKDPGTALQWTLEWTLSGPAETHALGSTLRWTRDSYDSENGTFLDGIQRGNKEEN